MIRVFPLAFLLAACAQTPVERVPPPEILNQQALGLSEDAWLRAYVENDRDVMGEILADGFTITFPNGRVHTKADVIAQLVPGAPPPDGPTHYTEGRTIRLYGTTAIFTGVYVSPHVDGTATRMRYTDTWMVRNGRWQVVASHLSAAE